ncbi:conserved protein of unknown function [Agreia sp. COWG]|nr:conserved protein of unknown function [Agreia sp. COWG]
MFRPFSFDWRSVLLPLSGPDVSHRLDRLAIRGYADSVPDLDHHNDPSRVIPVLEAELRPLAHDLLGAGFTVVDAWGPEQMAVAKLLLERDETRVLFDAERGMTSVILTRGERRVWLGAAIAAWARSPAADGRFHAADLMPWPLISTFSWDFGAYHREGLAQQAMHGLAVCEWFSEADLGAINAVESETRALDSWSPPHTRNTPAMTPELVAARYRDALDRYFGSAAAG